MKAFLANIYRRLSILMERYTVMDQLPLWARLDAVQAITWKGELNPRRALPIEAYEELKDGAWTLSTLILAGTTLHVTLKNRYRVGDLEIFLVDCPGSDEENDDRFFCLVKTADDHMWGISEWKYPKTTFPPEPE